MVQPDLDAAGGRAVDEDPFFVRAVLRQGPVANRALVTVTTGEEVGDGGGVVRRRGRRAVVRRSDGFADHVGVADPGALDVREDDGDGVAARLESVDEGEDVGGGLGAWRAVIVGYEDVHFVGLDAVDWLGVVTRESGTKGNVRGESAASRRLQVKGKNL